MFEIEEIFHKILINCDNFLIEILFIMENR